jgi:DNA-binding transcriptional ArsR family regulator
LLIVDIRFRMVLRSYSTGELNTKGVKAVDDALSRAFAALADPIRRDIVARLTADDATVTELAEPYDVSLQAVSKHLGVLEAAGLISRRRDGQQRWAHLEVDVFDLLTGWIDHYRRRAELRYQRLDAVLAERPETDTGTRTPRSDP